MDFQKLLLEVGKGLGRDEVKALAFLCTDLLGRNPKSVELASDLFSRLEDQDLLSPEQPQLLTELLLIIQRTRLVRDLGLPDPTRKLISPYRKLLYDLSEEITVDELKEVKFMLNKVLPRRKLEENVTLLEMFLEMEHMDLISDTNLNCLETIIKSVCPMLNAKISQFKALQVPQTNLIAQEVGGPGSLSSPVEPNQGSQSLAQTGLFDNPEMQSVAACSMNSSNTFTDFPHGGMECETLSHGLSRLSTESSSCASLNVRSDVLEMSPPQENKTASENQTSQDTDTSFQSLRSYPMTAAKRGICLIINNNDFTKSREVFKNREGTEVDENCLRHVFQWLGFEIQIHSDCNRNKMLSLLRELSRRDHSQMDCVVCCILSHGLEGSVYGVDGLSVKLSELMDPLDGIKCPSLAEKPKLFFIQACQGKNEQKAVYIEADSPGHISSDARAPESIPSGADFLVGMSTVPSFVSFREKRNGTWFIQSLCHNLVQMVPRGCDLVTILTKVNADVSRKTDSTGNKKQMPQPAFTLRKRVVFPAPKAPPPSLLSV